MTELDELVIIWWNNTEMEWHLKLSQAKYNFAQNATLHKMQLCTKFNFAQNATLHKLEMLKVIFSSLCTCVLQNHSLQSQNSEILKPAY